MARIAMLIGEDFEDSEFRVPFDRLTAAGHSVALLGAADSEVCGKKGQERIRVLAARGHSARDYDALVIPGGYGPDHLRTHDEVVALVQEFVQLGKAVAAVCHGPQLLIEADVVRGRTLTSWPSVRRDLQNAGARWVNSPVVEDGPFVTSRNPDDLEAFSQAILERLSTENDGMPKRADLHA